MVDVNRSSEVLLMTYFGADLWSKDAGHDENIELDDHLTSHGGHGHHGCVAVRAHSLQTPPDGLTELETVEEWSACRVPERFPSRFRILTPAP